MRGDELKERLSEYLRDARKLVEYAEEAIKHHEQGDLQATANVLAISEYTVSHFIADREGILEDLRQQGIKESHAGERPSGS